LKNTSDLSDGSEELLEYIKDWPSFYHLGNGSNSIFRSLDLPGNLAVLELGCGCGAVSRYLGENFSRVDYIEGSFDLARIAKERCRDLDNVRVYCSNIQELIFEPVYDMVTLIGVLEYAPVYLKGSNDPPHLMVELAKKSLKTRRHASYSH